MLAKTPKMGIPPELVDYAKEIERIINSVAHPIDHAEIGEDAEARWLLVATFNNEDARAARHLARRRFAVFRPTGSFPAGYLFVFVFDALKMLDRILACPGVKDVLCSVRDAFVQEIRAAYFYNDATPRTHVSVSSNRHYQSKPKKPKAKKLTKSERKALSKVRKVLKKLGFKDSSTLDEARALDVHERIGLLQRTADALTSAA